jgi:Flp pilus assembly protein TadG
MLSPQRSATRSRNDRGAVTVIVAVAMTALLVAGALVVDLGRIRYERQIDKSAADAAVSAGLQASNNGTGETYNSRAVCEAYQFLKASRAALAGLPPDVCTTVSQTQACSATTPVEYHGTTTFGGDKFEVWIKMPYAVSDATTGGAFGDESMSTLAADQGDSTQVGCDQLGVVIKESNTPGLGRLVTSSDLVTRIRSVARVKIGNGDPAPALLLLERTRCGVLQVGSSGAGAGSHIRVYGNATSPGTIHSDSDASDGSCGAGSGSQLIQGKLADGVVAYGSDSGTSGLITSVATQNGTAADITSDGLANVYAATGVSATSPGVKSDVTGRKRVTRKPVDRRYLSGVSEATQAARAVWGLNHAAPSGFTRYGCPSGTDMTAMAALSPSDKVYIDCPGSGMNMTGKIGAGTIYFHGFLKSGILTMPNAQKIYVDDTNNSGGADSSGAISQSGGDGFCVRAVSCVPSTPSTGQCSTTPTGPGVTSKAQLFIRRGDLAGSGLIRLCNTTVIMQDGDIGSATSSDPGGCLPTSWGTPPTATPCPGATAGAGFVSTGGAVDWTAPNAYDDMNAAGLPITAQRTLWDGGEDLALWTETYGSGSSYKMAGGASMHVAGVFMVPNAFPFQISGSGIQDLTNAQYVVRGFAVAGGATLTIKVDPNNVVGLPSLYDFRMVR